VIIPSTDNSLLEAERDAAVKELEKNGYKTVTGASNQDPTQERKLVQSYIALGVKGLIWDVTSSTSSAQTVQLAKDANIPSVLMDQPITKDGIAIKQLYSDNKQCGELAAQEFVKLTNGSGKYALLRGIESQDNETQRNQGILSVVSQSQGLQLVGQQSAKWDETQANQVTSTFLQKAPDLVGVIAENDTMALGAAAAITAAGKQAVVVGIDGSSDAEDAIKKGGPLKATAAQPLVQGATLAADTLMQYLTDHQLPSPERQQLPCTLFTG